MPGDFSTYPQPEWNTPDSIPVALQSVIRARDMESSSSAFNAVLYFVGNNHAGTYYPVVLAVLPELEGVLRSGNPWSQRTALEILIDLFSSFAPEPAYVVFHEVPLFETLRQRILALKPAIEPLAVVDGIAKKSAQELLGYLVQ